MVLPKMEINAILSVCLFKIEAVLNLLLVEPQKSSESVPLSQQKRLSLE